MVRALSAHPKTTPVRRWRLLSPVVFQFMVRGSAYRPGGMAFC